LNYSRSIRKLLDCFEKLSTAVEAFWNFYSVLKAFETSLDSLKSILKVLDCFRGILTLLEFFEIFRELADYFGRLSTALETFWSFHRVLEASEIFLNYFRNIWKVFDRLTSILKVLDCF